MKRENITKWMKKFTTGILAASLVLAGSMIYSTTTEAANESVTYDQANEAFEEWKTSRTAPVKAGYLFGGWYTSKDGGEVLTEETVGTHIGDVYAKFVPSYVLSVKAQIDANTQNNGANDKAEASIRILTGVDSLRYQYVGAKILLGNKKDINAETKTTVYQTLLMSDDDNTKKVNANELFGTAANYFSVWKIGKIEDINDDSIIYVRPYWVTMDGTIVYGLAKYVHVEDGYLGYVSVPINVMSGKSVAAGLAEMGYDSNKLQIIENGVESGRLFDDGIEVNTSITGSVKIAGNGKTVGTYKDESILANVRFKVIDGSQMFVEDSADSKVWKRNQTLTFDINDESLDFSNWDENKVDDPGVWNIQY